MANFEMGTIGWQDLTVENAEEIRDFYQSVVGWESRPEDMGGYDDFHMLAPATGQSVAGICHAQGSNADIGAIGAHWLVYIVVEDVDQSASRCAEWGGQVLIPPRPMGTSRLCVIRDPAGAVCALYQP